MPLPQVSYIEPFEDWKSRIGCDNPTDYAKARWYRQYQPDHPLIQQVADRRAIERANRRERRAETHEARVAAEMERQMLAKAQKSSKLKLQAEAKRVQRNLDFQARLNLGLMLSLKIDDAAEYDNLPQALECCSTLQELQKYCIMREPVNAKWLREVLPQVTNNSYQVADDLVTLYRTIQEVEPIAEVHFALLEECETFEIVEELVVTDGIVPTHVVGRCVAVECPPEIPSGYTVINHDIYYTGVDCKNYVVKSSTPIYGYESVSFDLPTYELLTLGLRLNAVHGVQAVKLGIWKEWREHVYNKLVQSHFLRMALTSGGLQRTAALSIIRFTIECAIPRNHHKVVNFIMSAIADVPP